MKNLTIVAPEKYPPLFPEHIKQLQSLGTFIQYEDVPNEENELYQRIHQAEILIVNNNLKLGKQIFAKLPKLQYVCVAAVGYDQIDVGAAKKQNIIISNAAGYNSDSVAEFTIGLLINASRYISVTERELRHGQWLNQTYKGKQLKNKTLGIVGYGTIGKKVAHIAKSAFNMNILFTNTKSSLEDLHVLLSQSDFLAITAPLTENTKGLIGPKEFGAMKPGIILVNTGRGAIIDEGALIDALKSKKIFAAGLDVLTQEPMNHKDELFSFPNVIITPHNAWNSEEAQYNLSEIITKNVIAFIQGSPLNVV